MAKKGEMIALAIGAFLLLGGLGGAKAVQGRPQGRRESGGVIFLASADEDIGIAQQPLANITPTQPSPGRSIVTIENGNTPVIDQRPVFEVVGSNTSGFTLTGPTGGLQPDTQIRVEDFGGGGGTFSTTPEVLARYLIEQGPRIDGGPAVWGDPNRRDILEFEG